MGAALLLVLLGTACGSDGDNGDSANGDGDGAPAEATETPAASEPGEEPTTPPEADADTVEALESLTFPAELAEGNRIGDADAPVHLVVYEDFQCPHCLDFTANIAPVLLDEFVTEGELLLEVRHFPVLGNASAGAAVASECAIEQGEFWEYHRQLFLLQATGEAFTADAFEAIAGDMGLNDEAFAECLRGEEALGTVSEQAQQAQSAGITGTPGFLLNDEPLTGGSLPADADGWRAFIEERLPE